MAWRGKVGLRFDLQLGGLMAPDGKSRKERKAQEKAEKKKKEKHPEQPQGRSTAARELESLLQPGPGSIERLGLKVGCRFFGLWFSFLARSFRSFVCHLSGDPKQRHGASFQRRSCHRDPGQRHSASLQR